MDHDKASDLITIPNMMDLYIIPLEYNHQKNFITRILASKALYVVKKEGYNAATNQNMTLLQAGTGF